MKPLLTQKEMDVVEDWFFCDMEEPWYRKNRPVLLRVWKKLCKNAGDK